MWLSVLSYEIVEFYLRGGLIMITKEKRPVKKDDQPAHPEDRYIPGTYKETAIAFLRESIDDKTYERLISHSGWDRCPYVAAKLFLDKDDWKKYIWIEQHGTLNGFKVE